MRPSRCAVSGGVPDGVAEVALEIRYDDVGGLQRHPPVRREAVMGDPAVPRARVGLGDSQRCDRAAAERS